MNDDFSLLNGLKYLSAFFLCLLLILLNAVPAYPLIGFMHAIPVALIVIFYFAIFNPHMLNGTAVFLLAVLADLLIQGPFGLLIISYVLMFFIGNFLRSYLFNLTFFKLWMVFGVCICLVEGLQYMLFCLSVGEWMSVFPNLLTCFVLILIYPFIMRLCAALSVYVREDV